MTLQEGDVGGTLGDGGQDHSRGVGGAGGRGTREGGSSAPHWGKGRAVTSSHGTGSLDGAGREEKIEVEHSAHWGVCVCADL